MRRFVRRVFAVTGLVAAAVLIPTRGRNETGLAAYVEQPMALDLRNLPTEALAFLTERHVATLTTLRPDGSPHVVAIAFTFDPDEALVRIITGARSRKVRHARRGGRAAVAQVDGPRWLSLEGPVRVTDDPERVAEAVRRHSQRYREPGENPERVAIEIEVERILGRA